MLSYSNVYITKEVPLVKHPPNRFQQYAITKGRKYNVHFVASGNWVRKVYLDGTMGRPVMTYSLVDLMCHKTLPE